MKKKSAYLGLLCAAAIILGYVESLFPVFVGVPGMKIGLPNLAVVMVLYLYSWKEAMAVSFVRILVIGFQSGRRYTQSSVHGSSQKISQIKLHRCQYDRWCDA